MERKPKKKIVFVCTGNTCRSPMAESLLKFELKKLKIKDFSVTSAGIAVQKGSVCNPLSRAVAKEYGCPISEKFKAKRLTKGAMESAYLIVAMTEEIAAQIPKGNVRTIRQLSGYDIPDPYGKGIDHYRYCMDLLRLAMPELLQKIVF